MQHPERGIWNKLIKLKSDLNNILKKKVEYALFCTQGERAGKVLAHSVKQMQTSNLIPSIFDNKNKLITNKSNINEVFSSILSKSIHLTRKH